jgi:arylsulfatase
MSPANPRFRLLGTALLFAVAGCAGQVRNPQDDRRPNILLIVADDLGYTDLGVYGGEIGTPNLDALARNGVLFTEFHAASTCSPTRAMLLSGMDNHPAGLGTMAHDQTPGQLGRPGYEGYLSFRVAALPELLREAGYHTYLSGKWHLGMDRETSPAARGFERSFGLMNGGSGHFDTLALFPGGRSVYREDGEEVGLPDDFYSTRSYAERMIEFLEQNAGDGRPFFAYLAFTAPHWPLQAPEVSIARFAGRFDDGYDALHARRVERLKRLGLVAREAEAYPGLPDRTPWEDLGPEQQRIEARKMEIYAAMVHDLDAYVGKVIEHLERLGAYDDTFILFMSDNGAEGHDLQATWPSLAQHIRDCCDNRYENMGNADSYIDHGPEWARAGIGVSSLYKGFSTQGAIKVPAFVSFPGRIRGPRVVRAFVSVMDVMPTMLELAGIEHPGERFQGRAVLPMQGRTMLPMLLGEAESVHGPEPLMAWELFGRRAVRRGEWKLTFTTKPHGPGEWQLFDLASDPAELYDLSDRHPEIRRELLESWDRYMADNGVILPETPSTY